MSVDSEKRLASITESLSKVPNLTYMGKCVERLNAITKTMVGATATSDGAEGFVPKPTKSNAGQFLRGDGTWHDVVTKEDADTVRVKSEISDSFDGYLLLDESSSNTVLNNAKKSTDALIIRKDARIRIQLGSQKSLGVLDLLNHSGFVSTIITDNRSNHTTYHLPNVSVSDTIILTTATLKNELVSGSTTYNINGTAANANNATLLGGIVDAYHLGTYSRTGGPHGTDWQLFCKHNLYGDNLFGIRVGDGTYGVRVDKATDANTLGNGRFNGFQLGTYADAGTPHDNGWLLTCKYSENVGRFLFQLTPPNGTKNKEVAVDYATKANSASVADTATTSTYASYKTGTSNLLVANNDTSMTIGGTGIKKTDTSTAVPIGGEEWYYRPITVQSTQPATGAQGYIWIKI